jgi:hypothetical protein
VATDDMRDDGWQILAVYEQQGIYNALRLEAALHRLAMELPKHRILNRQIGGGGGVAARFQDQLYGVYIVFRMDGSGAYKVNK